MRDYFVLHTVCAAVQTGIDKKLLCVSDFTQRQCYIPDRLSVAGCVPSFSWKHTVWSWDTFTGRPMFGDSSVSSAPISVQNKKESQHFCQPKKGLLSLRQRWIKCRANPNSWLKAWASPHQPVLLGTGYRLLTYDWYIYIGISVLWCLLCRRKAEWWFFLEIFRFLKPINNDVM